MVVELLGCIIYGDVGFYDDVIEVVMVCVLKVLCVWFDMLIVIQFVYVGCKVLCQKLWQGGKQILFDVQNGWQMVLVLDLFFVEGDNVLVVLDCVGMDWVCDVFVVLVECVVWLGIDVIQLYVVYGYLLYQFLLFLLNICCDDYGGSLENCMCFLFEVFVVVWVVLFVGYLLIICVFGIDWVEGGWDVEGNIVFVCVFEGLGCDVIYVFSGGLDCYQQIFVGFSYQVFLVCVIKQVVVMLVVMVGLIIELQQVEVIVVMGEVDMIVFVCIVFYDLCWFWYVVVVFGGYVKVLLQFLVVVLCMVLGIFSCD